jgi:hypothetical protein
MQMRYLVVVITLVVLALFLMAVANTLSMKPKQSVQLNTLAPDPYNP